MVVPLFPLHVVLFPGAALPLHVFEERYRTMMGDVLEGANDAAAKPFFVVALIREGLEVGGVADTHAIGCTAEIEVVSRLPDGRMELLTRGARRVRLTARPPDDPYPRAEIAFLDEVAGPRADEALALARAASLRYLEVRARVTGAPVSDDSLPDDPVAASYTFAHTLRVEAPHLQALLEAPTAAQRLALAAGIARREAALLETIGPPAGRPGLGATSLN